MLNISFLSNFWTFAKHFINISNGTKTSITLHHPLLINNKFKSSMKFYQIQNYCKINISCYQNDNISWIYHMLVWYYSAKWSSLFSKLATPCIKLNRIKSYCAKGIYAWWTLNIISLCVPSLVSLFPSA